MGNEFMGYKKNEDGLKDKMAPCRSTSCAVCVKAIGNKKLPGTVIILVPSKLFVK